MQNRCGWVNLKEQVYVDYHDSEWGKPLLDDNKLFELFSLETQAAGLSWLTVLKKREGYNEAFDGFILEEVAAFTPDKIDEIVNSGLVIKSKPKINAIVNNAQLFLDIKQEFGSIKNYFWGKVSNKQIINSVPDYKTTQCTSEISDTITKELKKLGFKFIGSTTIYAFMQACGMVDDHEDGCFCKNNKKEKE
jgi:DNA-3-methyladenine glycosylase I